MSPFQEYEVSLRASGLSLQRIPEPTVAIRIPRSLLSLLHRSTFPLGISFSRIFCQSKTEHGLNLVVTHSLECLLNPINLRAGGHGSRSRHGAPFDPFKSIMVTFFIDCCRMFRGQLRHMEARQFGWSETRREGFGLLEK